VLVIRRNGQVAGEGLPYRSEPQADIVAAHGVVRCVGISNAHTGVAVGEDDISLRLGGAADSIVGGGVVNLYAAIPIGKGKLSGQIRADVVAADNVGVRAVVPQADAAVAVAGDHVALRPRCTANSVARGGVANLDAVIPIGQGHLSGHVRANVVATDRIVRGLVDGDAGIAIAGNQVALAGSGTADGVAGDIIVNLYAVIPIGQGQQPGHVRANVVAADNIGIRAVIPQADAAVAVSGNEVALLGRVAADCVVGGAIVNIDTVIDVA
jgi:hypothetical protein